MMFSSGGTALTTMVFIVAPAAGGGVAVGAFVLEAEAVLLVVADPGPACPKLGPVEKTRTKLQITMTRLVLDSFIRGNG